MGKPVLKQRNMINGKQQGRKPIGGFPVTRFIKIQEDESPEKELFQKRIPKNDINASQNILVF